jgi:hypothetical protein
MDVVMQHQVSGTRDGVPWPPRGGVMSLPEDEAVILIAQGSAKPVGEVADEPETAEAPPVGEVADEPKRPRRRA